MAIMMFQLAANLNSEKTPFVKEKDEPLNLNWDKKYYKKPLSKKQRKKLRIKFV